MEESIFRKKSIERISSPEQLNDYVRVSNPSLWLIVAAAAILLFGALVWSVFGILNTVISTVAVIDNYSSLCYISEDKIASVKIGDTLMINSNEYAIIDISTTPICISEDFNEYTLSAGSLSVGDWVYEVSFSSDLPDGVYPAQLITKGANDVLSIWG